MTILSVGAYERWMNNNPHPVDDRDIDDGMLQGKLIGILMGRLAYLNATATDRRIGVFALFLPLP